MKEGVYFLKHGVRYDETKGNNEFLDYIPMLEIKNVFVKLEQVGIDSMEIPDSPLVRKISQLASFKTPSSKFDSNEDLGDQREVNESHRASRKGHEFQIETFDEDGQAAGSKGECSGRSYHIRVDSEDVCKSTVAKIDKIHRKLRSAAEAKSRFAQMQGKILKYYKSPLLQTIVAGLILAVILFIFKLDVRE
jgi:hypothetical protein